MPTLRQVNQRLARGDADRRAEHQREYLDRGIPQAHTRRLSTDHVEPRWAMLECTYRVEYQHTPQSATLVYVRPLIGPSGIPEPKDTFIRDLGAACGAAKRLTIREEAMRVRQWLNFKETAEELDLTESQLRSIVASGELTVNQPKRDGRRRFLFVSIEQYLLENGSYPPPLVAEIMARVRARASSPEAAETTQTTKTA